VDFFSIFPSFLSWSIVNQTYPVRKRPRPIGYGYSTYSSLLPLGVTTYLKYFLILFYTKIQFLLSISIPFMIEYYLITIINEHSLYIYTYMKHWFNTGKTITTTRNPCMHLHTQIFYCRVQKLAAKKSLLLLGCYKVVVQSICMPTHYWAVRAIFTTITYGRSGSHRSCWILVLHAMAHGFTRYQINQPAIIHLLSCNLWLNRARVLWFLTFSLYLAG
jgi:hypothetical protein